jgi:predicted RNA-binding Zn ribbon-like protein
MGLTNMLQDAGSREKIEDFVSRYDQGQPWEGISDDEAVQRHDEVASQLDDKEYEESARQTFQQFQPEQRKEVARSLRQGETDDPAELARATRQARSEQPDLLKDLMGNPALKGAVAGIAANAAKRYLKR